MSVPSSVHDVLYIEYKTKLQDTKKVSFVGKKLWLIKLLLWQGVRQRINIYIRYINITLQRLGYLN